MPLTGLLFHKGWLGGGEDSVEKGFKDFFPTSGSFLDNPWEPVARQSSPLAVQSSEGAALPLSSRGAPV